MQSAELGHPLTPSEELTRTYKNTAAGSAAVSALLLLLLLLLLPLLLLTLWCSYRAFASGYVLLSVGALGGALSGLSGARAEAKAEKDFRALMRRELDPGMLRSLDRDGLGVDKTEFVVGMLVRSTAVPSSNPTTINATHVIHYTPSYSYSKKMACFSS